MDESENYKMTYEAFERSMMEVSPSPRTPTS